jgi:hypothetical protein
MKWIRGFSLEDEKMDIEYGGSLPELQGGQWANSSDECMDSGGDFPKILQAVLQGFL